MKALHYDVSMQLIELNMSGLKLIKPSIFRDHRGFFLETFRQKDFDVEFVQDNFSFSRYGVLRGLHFQATPGQAKLVRAVQGKIFDVAVDIRPGSPTFKCWTSVVLDDIEHKQLYIPPGFAHGFCVLSREAYVSYKVSSYYDQHQEQSIYYNDPAIGIDWPVTNPILSKKDQSAPYFDEVFT
jgi:dTDP-4-dehydrorhamnose 3,5-epimerase